MKKVTFLTFYNDYSVGVYVLASVLQDAGYDVSIVFFKLPSQKIVDWFKESPIHGEVINGYAEILGSNSDVNTFTEKEFDILKNILHSLKPDVIAISSRSTDELLVKNILPRINSNFNVPLFAGGYGPTLSPEVYIKLVDYVFIGNAEDRIDRVIKGLEDKSIENMNNIIFQKNEKIIKNDISVGKISHFIFQKIPYHTYFIENNEICHYSKREDQHKLFTYYLRSHTYSTFVGRGCIASCSYCSAGQWRKIFLDQGIKVAKRQNRPIDDIIKELIEVKKRDYTFVYFRDEFICGSIDYLTKLLTLYEKYINLPFWAQFTPLQMIKHPELIELAVNAGFVATEIGFQSGSDEINRKIYNRKISIRETIDYAHLLSKFNIFIKYDFILFNPAEKEKEIDLTIKVIKSIPKTRANICFPRLCYFPGSEIAKRLLRYKNIKIDPKQQYRNALKYLLCFVMPENEFDNLMKKHDIVNSNIALLSFYKNYIKDNNIVFQIGSHEDPLSITYNRYLNIVLKNRFREVVIWGAGDYYDKLSPIFKTIESIYQIQDCDDNKNLCTKNKIYSPTILEKIDNKTPIFLCIPNKQKVKKYIIEEYPKKILQIYV